MGSQKYVGQDKLEALEKVLIFLNCPPPNGKLSVESTKNDGVTVFEVEVKT